MLVISLSGTPPWSPSSLTPERLVDALVCIANFVTSNGLPSDAAAELTARTDATATAPSATRDTKGLICKRMASCPLYGDVTFLLSASLRSRAFFAQRPLDRMGACAWTSSSPWLAAADSCRQRA